MCLYSFEFDKCQSERSSRYSRSGFLNHNPQLNNYLKVKILPRNKQQVSDKKKKYTSVSPGGKGPGCRCERFYQHANTLKKSRDSRQAHDLHAVSSYLFSKLKVPIHSRE